MRGRGGVEVPISQSLTPGVGGCKQGFHHRWTVLQESVPPSQNLSQHQITFREKGVNGLGSFQTTSCQQARIAQCRVTHKDIHKCTHKLGITPPKHKVQYMNWSITALHNELTYTFPQDKDQQEMNQTCQHSQWTQRTDTSQTITTELIIKKLIPWFGASKDIYLIWPCFPLADDSKPVTIILITLVVNVHKSRFVQKHNAKMLGRFS